MPMDTETAAKVDLRAKIAALRSGLTGHARSEKESDINSKLIALCKPIFDGSRTDRILLTYMPMGSEPDITPVTEWCWSQRVRVAVPRAIPATKRLALHEITGYEQLVAGAWGIREPLSDMPEVTDLSRIAAILVPGMAFDRNYGRLGYGGGYYDRLLASFDASGVDRPPLIAAAFDLQIVEKVPMQAHDVRLDRIVTETLELHSGLT